MPQVPHRLQQREHEAGSKGEQVSQKVFEIMMKRRGEQDQTAKDISESSQKSKDQELGEKWRHQLFVNRYYPISAKTGNTKRPKKVSC